MAEPRRLTDLVQQVSERTACPDGALVVALSGGADSAALALITSGLSGEVSLLHVDHGLTHSPQLRSAAVAIAERLGLALEISEVTVPDGPSLEGQARNARYQSFSNSVHAATPLLTGHTRDDQAETVLLNMIRGAGVRGMAGIPPFRSPNIYRPFLDVTRSETREIAVLAGLPFLDDPMNLDPTIRRNAIRLQMIPEMERYNSRLSDGLARLASVARADIDYLEAAALQIPIESHDDIVTIAAASLATADPVVSGRVIARAFRGLRGDGPSFEETMRILAVATGASSSEQLNGGLVAGRRGPMLVLESKSTAESQQVSVELTPGVHSINGVEFDVIRHEGMCHVAPIGVTSAVFPDSVDLVAISDSTNSLVVLADGTPAWTVGVKRHPVAFCEPRKSGYLSVYASEESGKWT